MKKSIFVLVGLIVVGLGIGLATYSQIQRTARINKRLDALAAAPFKQSDKVTESINSLRRTGEHLDRLTDIEAATVMLLTSGTPTHDSQSLIVSRKWALNVLKYIHDRKVLWEAQQKEFR
jgi:biopolymer transport protein ExbB/TolQ